MAVKAHVRGHEIYWDGETWRYSDDDSLYKDNRPCKRCGKMPTVEGYDACLGKIDGAIAACCGHGVEEPSVMYAEEVAPPEKGKVIGYKVLTGLGIPDDMVPLDLDEQTKYFLGQPNRFKDEITALEIQAEEAGEAGHSK